MNKVFNINLGNFPLTIDEDAYRHLENYLQSLHNHFRASEGYEEIMSDIEARLGELMREGMGKRAIATTQDVKNAVSVMGTPEDFGAQSVDNEPITNKKSANTEGSASDKYSGIKTGKQIFRDTDNKVIGGVCSGIAAYLGIADPLWVRLFFIGTTFIFGSSFLLYFILMVIIPKAETTADRLAMRGEPIDVNSIAKSVELGAESFSKKVNEFGMPENQARFQAQVSSGISKVGDVIAQILRGLGGTGKFFITGTAIFLLVFAVISLVLVCVGVGAAIPFVGFVTDKWWASTLAVVNIFILFAIPIASSILVVRRLLFGRTVSGAWHGAMWAFFGINAACLAILFGTIFQDFRSKGVVIQTMTPSVNSDILNLSTVKNDENNIRITLGDIELHDDDLLNSLVHFNIQKSDNGQWSIIEKLESQGRNSNEAKLNAEQIRYDLKISENAMTVPQDFLIPKGTKFRGQSVHLILKMPIGKKIKMDKEGRYFANFEENDDDKDDSNENDVAINEAVSTVWEMTDKGLKCISPALRKKKEE